MNSCGYNIKESCVKFTTLNSCVMKEYKIKVFAYRNDKTKTQLSDKTYRRDSLTQCVDVFRHFDVNNFEICLLRQFEVLALKQFKNLTFCLVIDNEINLPVSHMGCRHYLFINKCLEATTKLVVNSQFNLLKANNL